MAKENKDKSVLNRIDQLVKEEERLYAKGQLNVGRPEAFGGIEGGTRPVLGSVAAAPGTSKSSAKILIKRKSVRPKLLKTMSSKVRSCNGSHHQISDTEILRHTRLFK